MTKAPVAAMYKNGAVKRDIKDIWIEYKKTKTEAHRNILMENYLHLVRYNAERIHVKLPDEVELNLPAGESSSGAFERIGNEDHEWRRRDSCNEEVPEERRETRA